MTTPAAPPPIALTDLDRDELLQLFKERLSFGLRPSDLWRARWDVLSRRALAARERELAAFTAYVAVCAPPAAGASPRVYSAYLRDREAKRVAQEQADRSARRAEAAERRAWVALQACHGRNAA